jgi:twitching motility protein PilI
MSDKEHESDGGARGSDREESASSFQQRQETASGQPSLEDAEEVAEPTERQLLLLFSQGGNRFAVAVDNVLEVVPVPESTWVPGVAGWVQGVANFRGEIISIVSLGHFLDLDQAVPANGSSRLLVVQSREDLVRSGLVVDGVHGDVRASRDEIRPLTGAVQPRLAPYLRGLLRAKDELHALLDLESLLLSEEFRAVGSVR